MRSVGRSGVGVWEAQLSTSRIAKAIGKKCCCALGFGLVVVVVVVGSILSFSPALAQLPLSYGSPRAALTSPLTSIVSGAATTPEAKLTLRVYNYARIDSVSLTRSEKVADAIFKNVGIKTAWVDCPLSKEKVQAYPACQSDMGTADLVLKILPRHMAMKLRNTDEPLGFAQACPEGESACELSVFYHRVDELAAHGYREDRLLGYVIAHEVAHVLIGPGHSEEGIMRRGWTPRDLQSISLGLPLDFTNDQSRRLRQAVLRRTTPTVQEGFTQANLLPR
jgi:hypothetical protein